MFTKRIIGSILCLLIICSCAPKKKKGRVAYYDYETEHAQEYGTIDIPFRIENGVKFVSAKINGLSTDMIFDTGCSGILISPLEVQQLIKRDLLSEEDVLGTSLATIADGSVVEQATLRLNTLELTDGEQIIVCKDVIAQVSSNIEAPVLLGNGVLDRVASFTIDNEKEVIRFRLK